MYLEEINKLEPKNQLRKVQLGKVIKKEKQLELEEQVNIQEEELND